MTLTCILDIIGFSYLFSNSRSELQIQPGLIQFVNRKYSIKLFCIGVPVSAIRRVFSILARPLLISVVLLFNCRWASSRMTTRNAFRLVVNTYQNTNKSSVETYGQVKADTDLADFLLSHSWQSYQNYNIKHLHSDANFQPSGTVHFCLIH